MATLRTHNDEYNDSQRALMVPTDWLDQTCSSPGCHVVIRSRAGKQMTVPVCRWCDQQLAYYRTMESPPRSPHGPELGLAEFGRQLYEAIKLKAEAETARIRGEMMRAKQKRREAQEAGQIMAGKEEELGRLLDSGVVQPDDIRRILAIH